MIADAAIAARVNIQRHLDGIMFKIKTHSLAAQPILERKLESNLTNTSPTFVVGIIDLELAPVAEARNHSNSQSRLGRGAAIPVKPSQSLFLSNVA
jgi:hypothetical protein